MAGKLQTYRESKTLAYIVPFFAYMILLSIKGMATTDNPDLPWWQYAPEHWLFPIQTIVCLGLIAWWWKHYDFEPRGLWFGAAIGVLGLVLWILPTELHDRLGVADWAQPGFLQWFDVDEDFEFWKYLGLSAREEDGFDPTIFSSNPLAYWSTVMMRFIRMAVAVALLEEFFWRGFLWRYFINMDRPFWKTGFGTWQPKAVGLTILFFVLVHAPEDYLGCVIYGILISWVAIRTKSLAACVVCHAVTNFLLGVYVMTTGKWGFW